VTDVRGEIETNMDSAILDGGLLVLHFPWGVGAGGGGVARPGAVKSPCRILPHDSGRSSAQNPTMSVTDFNNYNRAGVTCGKKSLSLAR
jgi:hypothetical protein